MLTTTTELIYYLQKEKSERNFTVINAMVHTILSCGSVEDAQALYPVYLSQPGDLDHSQVLPVLIHFCNNNIVEKIYNSVTKHHRLAEGIDEGILQIFGKIKYEPSLPLLIYYTLEEEPYDYYRSKHAVLALLHFELENIKPLIKRSIEKCYGQSLFPEFVPALVCKLDAAEQQIVLEKLYELGDTTASTDCLGGIVLGFSLCGAAGEGYFWKVLFNPQWELGQSATGARHFAFQGLQNLGITFQQLFQKVKGLQDVDEQQYALSILLEMLEIKIQEPLVNGLDETFTSIFTTLFGGKNSNETDNLTYLAEKHDKSEEASRIEVLLTQKLKEEMLLKNFRVLKNEH